MKLLKPLRIFLALLFLTMPIWVDLPTYKTTDAAGYFLGTREVPGPLPPHVWGAWPALDVQRNIIFGSPGGFDLLLDYAKPSMCSGQKVPLVIYVHGGWWVGGSKGNTIYSGYAKMCYQLGFAFVSINYRLSRMADHPEPINDCKLAVRYFRGNAELYGIDPDKIGIWGGSAGGHLVSLMGTAGDDDGMEGPGYEEYSSRPQAVVDYCGIEDLTVPWSWAAEYFTTLFLGCNPVTECPDKAREASPVYQASPDDPPIMIMHGNLDPTVAYSQAEAFSRALHAVDNKGVFIQVTNGSHGFGGVNVSPVPLARYFMTVAHLGRHIEPELLCDLDMNGTIDSNDVQLLIYRLGEVGIPADAVPASDSWNPLADIYLDGIIDYRDLQEFCRETDPLIHIKKELVSENGKRKVFKITVENTGPLTINNLVITDTIPNQMQFVSSQPMGTLLGKKLTITKAELLPYSSFEILMTLKLPENLSVPSRGLTVTNHVQMVSDNTFMISDTASFKLAGISMTHKSDKFTVFDSDVVKFTVNVKNESRKSVSNCILSYSYPRELEFIKSNPPVSKGSGYFQIPLGTLNPGNIVMTEIYFRVKNIPVSGNGTAISCQARVTTAETNPLSDSASVVYRIKRNNQPLQININWSGINTKTNTAKSGEKVSIFVVPDGGSSPYFVKVDWGDGEKDYSSSNSEGIKISHTWNLPGEYLVRIVVTDNFGKMKMVERKLVLK